MTEQYEAPAAAEATDRGTYGARTSPQERTHSEGYSVRLRESLALDDVHPEITGDVPPGACVCGSPVEIGVTYTLPEATLDEPVQINACRNCAPLLISETHAISPPGHAIIVALCQ